MDRVFSKLQRRIDELSFVIGSSVDWSVSSVIAAVFVVAAILGGVSSWHKSCWNAIGVFFLDGGADGVLMFGGGGGAWMGLAALPIIGSTSDRTTSGTGSLSVFATREDGFLLGFFLAFFFLDLYLLLALALTALAVERVLLEFFVGAASSALNCQIRSLRRRGTRSKQQERGFAKAASAAAVGEELFLVIVVLSMIEMTTMIYCCCMLMMNGFLQGARPSVTKRRFEIWDCRL